MAQRPTVLDIEALRFTRPGAPEARFVIELPRLRLAGGQAIGVVGPSGCGKSTVIELLALLRRPDDAVRFELLGHDADGLWRRDDIDGCTALRAAHVGVVLQTGGLLPSLTLRENIALSQRLLGRLDAGWTGHLLQALDLQGLESRLPSQLSIGQRQRVAIARALAHRPALVLADEPTASLGVEHGPAALGLLLDLARDSGAALVVVSHDVALLRRMEVPLWACLPRGGAIVVSEVA